MSHMKFMSMAYKALNVRQNMIKFSVSWNLSIALFVTQWIRSYVRQGKRNFKFWHENAAAERLMRRPFVDIEKKRLGGISLSLMINFI